MSDEIRAWLAQTPLSRRQALVALAGSGSLAGVGSVSGQSAGGVVADEANFANYGAEQTTEGWDWTIEGETYSFDGSEEIGLPDGGVGEELLLPDGSEASEVIGPDGEVIWVGDVIPDSVEHHHPHDEGSGTDLLDNVANLDGTISTTGLWVSDANAVGGFYLSYTGSEETTFGEDAFSFTDASDFTVTSWVNPDAQERQGVAGWSDGSNGWQFEISANGNLQLVNPGVSINESTLTVPTNQFSFVGARYDVATEEVTYRLNSSEETVTAGTFSTPSNTQCYYARARTDLTDQRLAGGMDETTISGVYLSDNEMDDLQGRR